MLVTCLSFLDGKSIRQQIQGAAIVYKSLDRLAAQYLCSKFKKRQLTACNLRNSEKKLNAPLPQNKLL